jgi:hypothetical protein
MNRRNAVVALFALGAAPLGAWAQEPKKNPDRSLPCHRVRPDDPYIEVWRQGLRDLGYVEGRTIKIEYWTGTRP